MLPRKEEMMIAVSNFVLMRLTIRSSVFVAQALMPGWMQSVARYDPVDWAVEAGRGGQRRRPAARPRFVHKAG